MKFISTILVAALAILGPLPIVDAQSTGINAASTTNAPTLGNNAISALRQYQAAGSSNRGNDGASLDRGDRGGRKSNSKDKGDDKFKFTFDGTFEGKLKVEKLDKNQDKNRGKDGSNGKNRNDKAPDVFGAVATPNSPPVRPPSPIGAPSAVAPPPAKAVAPPPPSLPAKSAGPA